MRLASVSGVACAAAVLLGCGGAGGSPAPALERVRLRVEAPPDGLVVRGATVDVRGTVIPPSADVSVLGRPALVSEGRFTVVVPLRPGVTIVDVAASALRRRGAFAAIRVTRDVLVSVPDLAGVVEDDVQARLEPFGLEADITRDGAILDVLRPGDRVVCEQNPQSGARVRRGRVVQVVVAKRC